MSSDSSHQTEAVSAAERRLARLRFDLHDGPQQDVVMLADDLRRLRAELEGLLAGGAERERALGYLDELQARLVRIDSELRHLVAFAESPFLESESVPHALAGIVQEFSERTGVVPEVSVEGDFSELTNTQQITVLNLIREALTNVREHSDARRVAITVASRPEGIEATVTDDGRGFDPQAAREKAASEGHLGLVGMYARVELLGGRTHIDSRPGGPTEVSFSLPAWRPGG